MGNLENTAVEFKKTVSNDNTAMLNEIRKLKEIGNLEDTVEITLQIIQTLAIILDNETGNFENQTKAIQLIKSRTKDMAIPTEDIKTAVYMVQTSMIELFNETKLKESKHCQSEMGKKFN